MDVTRYVPLMATSSLVVARATDAVLKPQNAVAATSVAAVSVPTERIRCSSTRNYLADIVRPIFGFRELRLTPLRPRQNADSNQRSHRSSDRVEVRDQPGTVDF